MSCIGCTCANFARMAIKPERYPQKEIMIIGDIPTALEARRNTCMTGKAIDILGQTMQKVGLPTDESRVHLTTAIKCAVPKRKGKAIPVEPIRNCSGYIQQEVDCVQPKLVIILGSTAAKTYYGDTKLKITSLEGQLQTVDRPWGTYDLIVVKHPASIINAPGDYKAFYASMQLASHVFKGGSANDTGTTEWQILNTEEDCDRAVRFLTEKAIAYETQVGMPLKVGADIETTGLDYRTADFCVLGICFEKNKVFVVPRAAMHRCRDFFAIPNIEWTWHHGKYDSKIMWRRDLGVVPLHNDTIYMHYCLDETTEHNLGFLTKTFLQAAEYKFKMNQEFKAVSLETYDHYFESLCERVAVDSDYTWQLERVLREKLEEDHELLELYNDLIMPSARMLIRMEQNGMLLIPEHLHAMDEIYIERLDGIQKRIQQEAMRYWDWDLYAEAVQSKSKKPQMFNPASPKQMGWMVFDRLGLKPRLRKGRSTAKEILASIENPPELIKLVQEYRKVAKEQSTYVKGLLKAQDVTGDQRIHSNFSLHITATGRLSSKEPNLQNIPAAFGVGNVRRGFKAAPGKVLMEVDYSGAELRWAACLSGCPEMTKIFVEDLNLHDVTSEKLFGANFTKQDRMRAKACNFGILYGRQAQSFVDEFEMTLPDAQAMVDAWLDGYPGVKAFLQQCAHTVVSGGYLATPFKRRRRFGLVSEATIDAQCNEARNFPIQSSSSDTLLMSALELEPWFLSQDVKLVNLIHDSMLLEVPADAEIIQRVGERTVTVMKGMPEKLFGYTVPFQCDIDLGPTWGDLYAYSYKTEECSTKEGKKSLQELLISWKDQIR